MTARRGKVCGLVTLRVMRVSLQAVQWGPTVRLPKDTCAACPLRARCTTFLSCQSEADRRHRVGTGGAGLV